MQEVTEVLTGIDARKRVRSGVTRVYDAVRRTLGPEGKNAIVPRSWNRGPRMTNDGITIAENIMPKDEHERLVSDFFVEGSSRTNKAVGDGTSSTTVFAGRLVLDLLDQMGERPAVAVLGGEDGPKKNDTRRVRSLRHAIQKERDDVVELIKQSTKKIQTPEELLSVAKVSIGEDELAKTVSDLVWRVARTEDGAYIDNHIDVVEGYKQRIEVEVTEGMRFPAKVPHRFFVTSGERNEMVCENVHILVTSHKLDDVNAVVTLLQKANVNRIALVAPGFSMPVLQMLINSMVDPETKQKNGNFFYPVNAPALRSVQFEDIAMYADANFIDKDTHVLRTVNKDDLGFATKIIVKDSEQREDAVMIGGRGAGSEKIITRVAELKEQIKDSKNEVDKFSLERRIANLNAAVGVIRIGATTNAELLYLKHKAEDGVFACRAALEEGVVRGGGVCLYDIANSNDFPVIGNALAAPYNQIQENAGGNLDIAEDVIDPAKVVRLVVEHGASIAAQLITTEILIAEPRDKAPYEGDALVARAIGKLAYYDAKHHGLLAEASDEAEKDRERAFEEAMISDRD